MNFKPGDIVEFGYGTCSNNEYSAYRTILLLKRVNKSHSSFQELWRAEILNDSTNYYSDNLNMFVLDKSVKLVWRKQQKKVA